MSRGLRTNVALVTGATGFIGSRLVRKLVSEGWEVHVIVRPASSLEQLAPVLDDISLHVHKGTTEDMDAVLGTARPEIVFHLASLFLASHEPGDLLPLVRSNITFPLQLVQAMVNHGVNSLVNTGTSWQHYQNRDYSPVCLYAASKQAFEALLQFYVESTPLRAVTLELFDTYGPDDPRGKLFSLLRKAQTGKIEISMSPGEQRVDPIFIDDVLGAYLVAATRFGEGKVSAHEHYSVSSGRPIRLKDLVRLYERLSGSAIPVHWGGRDYRLREVMEPWSRGRALPGWRPEVDLEEGIRRILSDPSGEEHEESSPMGKHNDRG